MGPLSPTSGRWVPPSSPPPATVMLVSGTVHTSLEQCKLVILAVKGHFYTKSGPPYLWTVLVKNHKTSAKSGSKSSKNHILEIYLPDSAEVFTNFTKKVVKSGPSYLKMCKSGASLPQNVVNAALIRVVNAAFPKFIRNVVKCRFS